MAMTPEQMVAFHRQSAEDSLLALQTPQVASDQYLSLLNIQLAFKGYLMEGLISWRIDFASPMQPMANALRVLREGIGVLQASGLRIGADDLPIQYAAIVAFLLNEEPVLAGSPRDELRADSQLDWLLASGLHGEWAEASWGKALDQLRKINRSQLAVDTYSTYRKLLLQEAATEELVEQACSLFGKRASSAFYGGGDQTEGGYDDNKVTVDYRLAAILKRISYQGNVVHMWRWG